MFDANTSVHPAVVLRKRKAVRIGILRLEPGLYVIESGVGARLYGGGSCVAARCLRPLSEDAPPTA